MLYDTFRVIRTTLNEPLDEPASLTATLARVLAGGHLDPHCVTSLQMPAGSAADGNLKAGTDLVVAFLRPEEARVHGIGLPTM